MNAPTNPAESSPALGRRLVKTAAVLVLLPLIVTTAAFPLLTGLPDPALDTDMAMIELYTLHAVDRFQTVGPYSRFGWNHPGPAYFYMLAPLYAATGKRSSSLFLSAWIISAIAALTLVVIVMAAARPTDLVFALTITILFAAYGRYLGPKVLGSPWNAGIIVTPFALYIVCLAAFAHGAAWLLPLAAGVGSFLAQTHVGVGPTVAASAATAFALYAAEARRRHIEGGSNGSTTSLKWPLLAAALVTALMWAPPLIEEFGSPTGNMSKLVEFFTSETEGYYLEEAFFTTARQIAWPIVGLVRLLPVPTPWFEMDLLAGAGTAVYVAGLAIESVRAFRSGRSFRAAAAVLCVVGTVVAFWSALQVRGNIFVYLVRWISALGLVGWAVIAAGAVEWAGARVGAEKAVFRRAAITGVVILLAGLSGVKTWTFLNYVARPPTDSPIVESLSAALIDHAREYPAGERPLIRFEWSAWTWQAGIIVQLLKAEVPFATTNVWKPHAPDWPLLLGSQYAPSGREPCDVYFVRESINREAVGRPVGRFGGVRVEAECSER